MLAVGRNCIIGRLVLGWLIVLVWLVVVSLGAHGQYQFCGGN